MLWEQEPTGNCFSQLFPVPEISMGVSRNTKNMFSTYFRKFCDEKKNQLLLARATMMLTAQASSVFHLSYRSTILNQSVHIFMLAINILLKVNTTHELIPLERRPFFCPVGVSYRRVDCPRRIRY